jgi:hypothetical protein
MYGAYVSENDADASHVPWLNASTPLQSVPTRRSRGWAMATDHLKFVLHLWVGLGKPDRTLRASSRLAAGLVLGLGGTLLVGCSAQDQPVQVDATVRINVCDGDVCTFAPVSGAHVRLLVGGAVASEGMTDENGQLRLTSSVFGDGTITAEWGSLRSESTVAVDSPSSVSLAFTERAIVRCDSLEAGS